jgi:hypothetical protein
MRWPVIRLLILFTLFLPAIGSGQTGERRLAISDEPFFEMFSLKLAEGSEARSRPAIYEQGPFAFSSIPSIARAPDGRLFLAWIAEMGFARGGRIVGAYSSDGGRTWGTPLELINQRDRNDGDPVIIVDGHRLMVISTSSRLPERADKFNPWPVRFDRLWWYMTSTEDDGKTWSKPVEVKCPHLYAGKRSAGYKLKDGTLVQPYYYETAAERGRVPRLEGDMRVVAGMVRSRDGGRTWVSGQMVDIPDSKSGADEPATVLLSSGEIFCLLRNDLDRFYETRSLDGGLTWNPPKPSPLAAHGAPAWLHRLEDRPGDELIVGWDNSTSSGRWPLVVAYSLNGGHTWSDPKLISNPNPREGFRADYPTICQTKDGIVVLAWQEETLPRHLGKEIRLARFNRAWLMLK